MSGIRWGGQGSPPARWSETTAVAAGADTELLPTHVHEQAPPTTALPAADVGGQHEAAARVPVPSSGSPALISRQVAAEVGMYLGAALALVALGGTVVRGWAGWGPLAHGSFVVLAATALLALGVIVRLPWARQPTDQGRRATSTLMTLGAAVALVGAAGALGVAGRAGQAGSRAALAGVTACLVLLLVNLVSRTPLSESGLLLALVWSGWALAPTGASTWAVLTGLGVMWAGFGHRVARGRRTAGALGSALALVACVGLGAGPWSWAARAGLATGAACGLGMFLRGGANHWLALGAGASTALAASAAGVVAGPAVALLAGGLATMTVSWIALRRAGSP